MASFSHLYALTKRDKLNNKRRKSQKENLSKVKIHTSSINETLIFKKVSDEQLSVVKNKYLQQLQKEESHNLFRFIAITLLLISFIFVFYFRFK